MRNIIVFILIVNFSFAQNFVDDVQKMRALYNPKGNFSLSTVYKIVNQEGQIKSSFGGGLLFYEGNYEVKVGEMTTIAGSNYNLMINDKRKQLILTERISDNNFADQLVLSSLDTSILKQANIVFETVSDSIGKYTIKYKRFDNIPESQVFFSLKSYQIKKMVLTKVMPNGTNQFMEVYYSAFTTEPKFDKKKFNVSSYILKEGNKLLGVGEFQKYLVHANYNFK